MRKTVSGNYKYHSLISSGAVCRKKRFRSVIITRSVLIATACVISAVIFLFTAWMILRNFAFSSGDTILKAGMAEAVPFLSLDKNEKNKSNITSKAILLVSGVDFKNPVTLIASASPMFASKIEDKKTDVKKEEVFVLENSNITETNTPSVNLSIKNESKYEIDTKQLLNADTDYNIEPDKPSVLIVHTHGSESYTASKAYNYTQTGNYRTQDTKYNMIRLGEELEKHLKSAGIGVVHDKTINDYPSYNDSYNKTEKVIRKNLEKYPSICFVFDIHRDAAGDSENGIKFTSTVNGEKAAQVMIVCGTDQNLENPKWRENLTLALKIQSYFEKECPSFMRPLNLRKERFNMHLTTGSLLFEIGTNSNTLDEALASARCLGDGLAEVIKNLR